MRINKTDNSILFNKLQLKVLNNAEKQQKSYETSANDITSSYNIAFCGLFKKKTKKEPIFPDVSVLWQKMPLVPNQKYVISENSIFLLPDYILDIGSRDIKPIINSLKCGEEIIFGRNALNPDGRMSDTVNPRHLKISRDAKGRLLAEDMNSVNGTQILPTYYSPDLSNGQFQLTPGVKYSMPLNSILGFCGYNLYLETYKSHFDRMQDGQYMLVGRAPNSNIVFNDSLVSMSHLKLTKYGKKVLVEDLHSTNGTSYIGKTPKYSSDYSRINNRTWLTPKVPTKVPNNSQIYLGQDLTIDLRNRNILDMLEAYDTITIGRNLDCDFVVPDFYDQVSGKHLVITKDDKDIIVTDLGSLNGTEVIPKNCIRPFYGDLNNLNLKQGNIGDCYLLATLYAISRNPKTQSYLRNLVHIDDYGNYIVSFYNSPQVVVPLEELDGQINAKGKEKRSVSGDLGIKAIERAYAKVLKEEKNQKRLHFLEHESQTMFGPIDDGGYSQVALKKMTGINSITTYLPRVDINSFLNNISNKGLDNQIITCSTYGYGKYDGFTDPEKRFTSKHAYAVKYINPYSQKIGIVNPHNTKYVYDVSWQEFSKYFDFIHTAYI